MSEHETFESIRGELTTLADEIEVKLHLAKLDARDQWAELKTRLAAIEQRVAASEGKATAAITKELRAIGAAFARFRDEMIGRDGHA